MKIYTRSLCTGAILLMTSSIFASDFGGMSERQPGENVITAETRGKLISYVNHASVGYGGLSRLMAEAESGNADAALPAAVINLVGAAGYGDGEQGIEYLHQASNGSPETQAQACWLLSRLYAGELTIRTGNETWWMGAKEENAESISENYLMMAAEAGSPHAQVYIARQYLSGEGKPHDIEAGLFLLSRVIQGRSETKGERISYVGDLIWMAKDHPIDMAYSMKDAALGSPASNLDVNALRRKAMEGDPAAMTDLAAQFLAGGVLGHDEKKARRLLSLAAEMNYVPAEELLARL